MTEEQSLFGETLAMSQMSGTQDECVNQMESD